MLFNMAQHMFQEFDVSEEKVTKMNSRNAGVRVVRGPDWMWKSQDGGEGGIGIVINPKGDKLRGLDKWVNVHWNHGDKMRYRAGVQGDYDLRIYDNSTAGVIHPSSSCSACGESPLRGMRWNCLSCLDVDLCTSCYMEDCHDTSHKLERIDNPGAIGVQLGQRLHEKKVPARGMLPSAIIQHKQSGLKGTFKKWIQKYPEVVQIEDENGEKTNLDLMEHDEVAFDCRKLAQVGTYYKRHLPKLSFHYKDHLKLGDRVFCDVENINGSSLERVDTEKNKTTAIIGTVVSRVDGQEVVVDFNCTRVSMKSYELTKVQQFETGDHVRIIDNETLVEKFHADGKNLLESIYKGLGKNGVVKRPEKNGYALVVVGNQTLRVSPTALVLRHSESGESSAGDTDNTAAGKDFWESLMPDPETLQKHAEDFFKQHFQEHLFTEEENAAVKAVCENNFQRVKDAIEKNPAEVNNMHNGKTLLHHSCHQGFGTITLFLLEHGAELERKDSQGYTALHHSAYGDQSGKTAKLLVSRGADVNSEGTHKETPLHLAVKRENEKVAKHLINANCDINKQDMFGDTPLHDTEDNVKLTKLILSSELSNPSICNRKGFNVLHNAAIKGNERVVKVLLNNCQNILNTQKSDGYSSLHLASLNGHEKVVTVLLQEKEIAVDALTENSETALHLASKIHNEEIVDKLIEKNANVNASDKEGNTPLHLAVQENESPLDPLKLFMFSLMSPSRQYESKQKAENIVNSLLKAGADPDRLNEAGKIPAEICKFSIVEDLLRKASKQKR